jgi:hypothetical protein
MPEAEGCRWQIMSAVGSKLNPVLQNRARKRVSIRRDDEDFVIAFQPENIIVFSSADMMGLRKLYRQLRWEVESDVIEPGNPMTW